MNNFKFNNIILVTIVSIFLAGCAKQNAFILKQGYHDVTSQYNAYFNAKNLYKLTVKSVAESKKENYDDIISLYAHGTLEDSKSRSSEFTTIIDKSTKAIQLHTISNWTDDNFLLLGKAFFMQGEYKKAEESLRYITANFRDGVDGRSNKKIKKHKSSKRKKAKHKKKAKKNIQRIKDGKDIRPKKNLIIHEPVKAEALIWLVKTFTANKEYSNAAAVLDYIESDNSFIQNYDVDKELAYSYFFIEQNNFNSAILHLDKVLTMYKSNKKKSRYNFVMAQLFEKTGNKKDAFNYYEKSIKGNSSYDMIFNAQLKMIELSNGNSSDKEDKLLSKLIKDSKNIDYVDRLYYEKAVIALNNKNKEKAILLLNKSIKASTKNTNQKAKSLELLAGILYDDELFSEAQINYAECLNLIDITYKNYKLVSKRANVLNDLVEQLNTILKNDSLLIIAEMPKDKIEEVLYQQAVDKIDAKYNNNSNSNIDKFASNDKVKNDGKWYFYSETAKTVGFAKFQQLWGERKLEDDWRRIDKTSKSSLSEEPKTEEEIREEKINILYEFLLAEIPDNAEKKNQYIEDIATAHYNAANIYKYELENDNKAIQHFISITKKYSLSQYDAESLFNLYLLNKKIKNNLASNKNKKMVLSKYPKSKYAKIINNPSYAETLKGKAAESEVYYEDTYNKYVNNDFASVITRIEKSKTLYPNNKLSAKFDLLKAVTLGKQKKYQPYVDELAYVINTYKDTEEQKKASEMLAYLKGEFPKEKAKTLPVLKEEIKKEKKLNGIFDKDLGKDKEGFKVKLGKKDVVKVGINEEAEKNKDKKPKTTPEKRTPNKPKLKKE